nr:MAG TPA: hypothetical protein [Caudoviricetes sp.]
MQFVRSIRKMLTKMLTSFIKSSVFNVFIAISRGFNSPHLHQNIENQQSIAIAGFSLFINALRCFRKSLRCEKRRGFTIIFRIMQTHFVSKMLTKMLTACFKLQKQITVIGKAPAGIRRGCMCCAALTSFPSSCGLHP